MPQSTTFATSPVLGTQEAPTDGSFLGRHEALQQLLKILPYCQSGQGKTVLLTGAEGLGKTTLIEQFMIQAHGSLGLSSIYVPVSAPTTLTQFVQSMVQALEQTAASVAEGLLVQIQADLDSIGIRWDQEQILSLLKPFFEDPHTITRPDTFAEALKSYLHNAVSFFKRLHPNVEGVIGGLVQTLTHPWLLIYAGMYYGQLQSYSQLKEALAQLPLEQLSVFVTQTTSADTLVSESPLPEEGGGLESEIHSAEPALKSWTAEVSSIRPVGQSASNAETTAEGSASSLNGTVLLAQSMAQLILALSHILSLYKHAFVLCFDQWDSLQDCVYEQQSAIKQFVSELIRHTAEKRNFFGFILLACRSEHESYLLGSALYNRFRQKMLLGPLSEKDMSALLSS